MMGYFVAFLFGLCIVFGFVAVEQQANDLSDWATRCRQQGGVVEQNGWDIFSQNYECYKSGSNTVIHVK